MHILICIVPSAPEDFMLMADDMSPTMLLAFWTEPNITNGTITAYTINCTSPSEAISYVIDATETSAVLDGLIPFTNYTCVIFASSEEGEGNCSEPQTAMTIEDCKLR